MLLPRAAGCPDEATRSSLECATMDTELGRRMPCVGEVYVPSGSQLLIPSACAQLLPQKRRPTALVGAFLDRKEDVYYTCRGTAEFTRFLTRLDIVVGSIGTILL